MMLSSSSEQSQAHLYSQHSRHPYNPYPHQSTTTATLNHQPQCPQYTLQAQTPLPTVVTSASSSPSLSLLSESSSTHSSIQSSSPPPPDMLSALERLLMGISPFPPTIPTLAKPTCPSLDDLTLPKSTTTVPLHNNFRNENGNNKFIPASSSPSLSSSFPSLSSLSLSSPLSSSSSFSSAHLLSTHTQPADSTTALSTESNFGHLDHCYRPTTNNIDINNNNTSPISAAAAISQDQQYLTSTTNNSNNLHHRTTTTHGSISSVSPTPTPLTISPSNMSASSPMYGMDSDHDMPHWSPSSPPSTLSMDHRSHSHNYHSSHHRHNQQHRHYQQQHLHTRSQQQQQRWSAGSSPLSPSVPHQQDSFASSSASSAATWGYSLFEPTTQEPSRTGYTSSSNSNHHHHRSSSNNHVSFHHRSPTHNKSSSYLNSRSTPAGSSASYRSSSAARHTSSSLSDVRAYESGIRHSYYSPRHYRTSTTSSSTSSSSSSSSSPNSNKNNGSNNHAQGSSSSSSQSNTGNTARNDSSNSGGNENNDNTRPPPAGQQITRGEPKSFPCQICTKPFPTRTQLKSHMAIHVDNFPFPCPYTGCDLHFKRKHDLRRHVDAKHALVKKYLCSGGCGEGFGRRDQMLRHLKRGHCQIKPEGDPARSVLLLNQSGNVIGSSSTTGGEKDATGTSTTACGDPVSSPPTRVSYPYQAHSSSPSSSRQQRPHSHSHTHHHHHHHHHQQQQQQLRGMNHPPMSLPLS